MQSGTVILLGGSSNGQPVVVAATATLGTTIHTAVSGTSSIDKIWLWAQNFDSQMRTLNLQWGNASRLRKFDLLPNTETLISPGWPLQNGLLVTAFTPSAANMVEIIGHANRIV